MRRQFPKADGGKWSQGLGEAEKGETDELVAGNNPGYCIAERKLIFVC